MKVIIGKISVRAHAFKFLCHSNMCFVYSNALVGVFAFDRPFISPFELVVRVPETTIVQVCVWVLDAVSGPCGVFIFLLSIRTFNLYFIPCVMLNSWFAVKSRNYAVKLSVPFLFTVEFISVPAIEFSKDT